MCPSFSMSGMRCWGWILWGKKVLSCATTYEDGIACPITRLAIVLLRLTWFQVWEGIRDFRPVLNLSYQWNLTDQRVCDVCISVSQVHNHEFGIYKVRGYQERMNKPSRRITQETDPLWPGRKPWILREDRTSIHSLRLRCQSGTTWGMSSHIISRTQAAIDSSEPL